MDYLQAMEIQEQIIYLEKSLKEKISYIDDKGNRKLDPYYFLSAEVAAYKLLSTWHKRMQTDLEAISEEVAELLDLIKMLVDESYEDYQTYEADISMDLWYQLAKNFSGDALVSFNAEIIVLASYVESLSEIDPSETLICKMSDEELTDPNLASYAYSIVHNYLISLSRENLESFAEMGFGLNASKGELHKLHFNLFQ